MTGFEITSQSKPAGLSPIQFAIQIPAADSADRLPDRSRARAAAPWRQFQSLERPRGPLRAQGSLVNATSEGDQIRVTEPLRL